MLKLYQNVIPTTFPFTKATNFSFEQIFNQQAATWFPVLNLGFGVTPNQWKILNIKYDSTFQLVYQKPSDGGTLLEEAIYWRLIYIIRVSTPCMLLQRWTSTKKLCAPQKKKKSLSFPQVCIKRYWNRLSLRHPGQLHVWRLLGSLGGHRSPRQTGRLQARCRLVYSKKAVDWDLFGSGWTSVFPELILACNSV